MEFLVVLVAAGKALWFMNRRKDHAPASQKLRADFLVGSI
jgi:hypothetical protein